MLEVAVSETISIEINGKVVELPVVTGTENEKGIDVTTLRKQSGYITLDPGFVNTGACKSSICFIDGEKGILNYRGIPIEALAIKSNFIETAYLLYYGKLPTQSEFDQLSQKISTQREVPELIKKLYDGFSTETHPMAILSSVVSALSGYDTKPSSLEQTIEEMDEVSIQLMSQFPTIAAYSYRKLMGLEFIDPDPKASYTENFLKMMFTGTEFECHITPEAIHALEMLLILHADHEQNCSASTVQMVGSARTNIYASIAAGIGALWGPWHGGANQDVVEMLQEIKDSGGDVAAYIKKIKDPKSKLRLAGFGHRVYKTFDPRAKVIKSVCDNVLEKLGVQDPLLDIARELEIAARDDEYFVKRKLYPNVDFYSGIIYKAIGIPTNMFTVMFAIGRLPGWLAHWKEMITDKPRIGRPRQIYVGPPETEYVPIAKRS